MARQRLGVVLRVPQPLATEIDGLRRATGDPMLGRVEPHATLVPPVNVHDRDIPAALAVLRAAAAEVGPLALTVGPGATFHPAEPVVYLAVTGERDGFERLRTALLRPPLDRTVHDPWVPHVTVSANLAPPERIPGAVALLAGFEVEVRFDRVHLLSEGDGRIWRAIADAPLGERPATVGRGSLPLELSLSGQPDLEAAALLAVESDAAGRPFGVTARSGGRVVGAAWGWTSGARAEIADLAVAAEHRSLGIGRHLLAAVESVARRRSCSLIAVSAPGQGAPASLLSGAGWTAAGEPDRDGRRSWMRSLQP